jgi:LL-diaminopimelate aminotransferase
VPIKKVVIEKANRLYQLPPEVGSFTEAQASRAIRRKTPVIDLAGFSWPVTAQRRQLDWEQLMPADQDLLLRLKQTLAAWYQSTHGVRLNPEREIFIGNGVSRIAMTLALAFVDSGDIAFVPALGIPLYRKVVTACGGEAVGYSVALKDNWRPNFEKVSTRLGRVARLLFINSPHNPTGTEMRSKDWEDLIWTATRENITLVNDAVWQTFPSHHVPSMLSVSGARKTGVELGSFAYNFGLPPIPFGYAAGNREIINGLMNARHLVRPYLPAAFAEAAIEAVQEFPAESLRRVRQDCRQALAESDKFLKQLNLESVGLDTVPYVWARLEPRGRARRAAELLFKRARIQVIPGNSFGDVGQGYLRLSLTAGAEAFAEAAERLARKRTLMRLGEQAQ